MRQYELVVGSTDLPDATAMQEEKIQWESLDWWDDGDEHGVPARVKAQLNYLAAIQETGY